MSGRFGDGFKRAFGFGIYGAPTLGIALVAVLAIATPLQAQSDQGLILVFQEYDARVNLQDSYTPDATFRFGGRGTSAVAAEDGAGAETEVPPQTSLLKSFATFRESWEPRDSCSGSFSALKPSAPSGTPHPEPGAEDNRPGKGHNESSNPILPDYNLTDRNRSIYYKNKLEFSGLCISYREG